jgi:hypothetical protein
MGESGELEMTNLSEELLHDLGPVVDSEHNVLDTGSNERLDLVDNHWLVGELDKRLGEGKSERAKARAKATDEDKSLHGCDCVDMVVKEGCGGGGCRLKEFRVNAEKERRWKNERELTLELKK